MRRRIFIFWIIITCQELLLLSCNDGRPKSAIKNDTINKPTELDTSMYAILPVDSTSVFLAPHTLVNFSIPVHMLSVTESLLQIAMADTSGLIAEERLAHTNLQILGEYRRQYLPVQRDNDTFNLGKLLLRYIKLSELAEGNCVYKGRGNCYFQVLINLRNKMYSCFLFNGEA